jgi:hypothetical protein
MTTGDVAILVAAEPDYRHGVGELRLRVQAVDRSGGMHLDGELRGCSRRLSVSQ